MTQIKRRKGKNLHIEFSHIKFHVVITMSEDYDIVTMTGNFTSENMINEFLPFSAFN